MDDTDDFEVMVDACLKAYTAVTKTGAPEMLNLARLLLLLVGQEAAKQASNAKSDFGDQ